MALQKPYDSKLYTISATLGKLILQDHSIILNFNYFFVANCSVCPIDRHIFCLFAFVCAKTWTIQGPVRF